MRDGVWCVTDGCTDRLRIESMLSYHATILGTARAGSTSPWESGTL